MAGYEISVEDQARYTADFIAWCKKNGVSGIRPWGPDVLGYWTPMSLFSYDATTNVATAKPVFDVFTGKLVGMPVVTRTHNKLTADLSKGVRYNGGLLFTMVSQWVSDSYCK